MPLGKQIDALAEIAATATTQDQNFIAGEAEARAQYRSDRGTLFRCEVIWIDIATLWVYVTRFVSDWKGAGEGRLHLRAREHQRLDALDQGGGVICPPIGEDRMGHFVDQTDRS
jgi:hypothetical protein